MENRRRRPRNEPDLSSSCPPGWTWLLAGILIGMFISFLFYLQKMTPVVSENLPNSSLPSVTSTPSVTTTATPQVGSAAESTLPKAVTTSVSPKSFTFDKFLDTEVKVEGTQSTSEENLLVTVPGTYVLQVGSFRDKQQAKGLVTHLASLGIQAYVKQFINAEEEWFQVQVGPFTDLDELNQTRGTLTANDVPTILLSVKNPERN